MVKYSKQHCVEVRNRQKKWPMDRSQVHSISLWVAGSLFKGRDIDLSVQFLSSARMAEINQSFLGHEGPTDVITFDLSEEAPEDTLVGEILICPDVAMAFSQSFGTHWYEECMRYLIHGLLHLAGFDDLEPEPRRLMKRHEHRWVRRMHEHFSLPKNPPSAKARRRTSFPSK